jgi:hypothetical protein
MLGLTLVLAQPVAARSPGILLTISEPDHGQWIFMWIGDASVVVNAGEELDFTWTAEYDVQETEGTILGFRWGWDLTDPDDPDDPGWEYEGLADVTSAPRTSFQTGTHNLVVWTEDDIGRISWGRLTISVEEAVSDRRVSVGQVKGRRIDRH